MMFCFLLRFGFFVGHNKHHECVNLGSGHFSLFSNFLQTKQSID